MSSGSEGSGPSAKAEGFPKGSDRKELWDKIVETLDDTLQYGFLEETRFVSEVYQEGSILTLVVPPRSAEAERAFNFLAQPENRNRILILAKRLDVPTAASGRTSAAKPSGEAVSIETVRVIQE